jgi:hypothetical protein
MRSERFLKSGDEKSESEGREKWGVMCSKVK